MSFIAILGAGAIGGALAQRLAARDRVGSIRLIDASASIAQGKALDILQSSPIDGFGSMLSGSDRLEVAAGAAAIIVADSARDSAEHSGEAALTLLRQVAEIERKAPLVFAGAAQRQLIGRVVSELHVPT